MTLLRSLLMILAAASLGTAALAADLKVLTAGALKPLVMAVAPEFERDTGHRLLVDNDTAGGLRRRVLAGEAFDVVVLSADGLEALAQAGKLAAGSGRPVARIGIGVAVPQGAPAPDISTEAGFRQALLQARAVAYIDPAAGGSSGIYLDRLFQRLGLAEQIRPKAVLVPGGLVAQRLLDGGADLALQQMSELVAVPGVTVLGPLPAALQNHTVYSAAMAAASSQPAAAQALLTALGAPAARRFAQDHGMQPWP